jgi:hypothetical protein
MTEPQPIALTTWLHPPTEIMISHIQQNKKLSLEM